MSKKPYMVYYVGVERKPLLLPSLRNKYEVRFIVNPNRKRKWRGVGRKKQLHRAKEFLQLRQQYRVNPSRNKANENIK